MLAHVRLTHSQFQRLKSFETLDNAGNHPEKLRAPCAVRCDLEARCEDSDDFELLVPVTKVLTWSDDIVGGTMRMSDGRVVIANGYNKGPVFFEATFPGGETLATCTPNQYLEPEGRFIPRPPSALPHKGLAIQPEPKPKAQTKNKDHTRGQGQIESETKRQSKACTDPGKTQDAGASGTDREEQVKLPSR